jgi:hypothetical protein
MSAKENVKKSEALEPLFAVVWDKTDWVISVSASVWILVAATAIVIAVVTWRLIVGGFAFKAFEIDQADIGIGKQKFSFKPNLTDKQVAYAIWVELSTRKIGLPIDFENDVVSEIYDSWYGFFTVTRELVKGIPVQKVKRDSTQAIIKLSIEVLNEGLRPHLTMWQARFRHWYERELKKYDLGQGEEVLDPQKIQAKFPSFEALKTDMERVNLSLIKYRRKMHQLVLKD